MNRYRNILLVEADRPISADEASRAVTLARRNAARLTVLSVLNPRSGLVSILTSADTAQAVQEGALRERATRLHELLPDSDVVHGIEAVMGPTAKMVIDRVRRGGHDLVLAVARSARGRPLSRETRSLVRRCPCPVWVLRAGKAPKERRILAAVEADPDGGETSALDRRVLEIAASLAERHRAELHVVTVWSAYGDVQLGRRSPDGNARLDLRRDAKGERHRDLDSLLASVPAARRRATLHLRRGRPASEIRRTVEEADSDLLVIGSRGRRGLAGLLLRNTAETVLGRVGCEVITVRPEPPVAAMSRGELAA